MLSETTRRKFMTSLLATGPGLLAARSMMAQTATPENHDHEHEDEDDHQHESGTGTDQYLLVGDPLSKTVSAYDTADSSLIGTIDGIVVNGHAGSLPLPDGAILLIDDEGSRLLKLGVHDGHFEIMGEASISGHVAHIAVESDHAHTCAIGTSAEDEFQLHLVDLESWVVTSVQLPDAGEVGLMLTHDNLFHRNSTLNRVEAYDLNELLAGNVQLLSSVEIGTSGHGEAVNEETGELFMLTDDGVDIAYWESPEITFGKTIPWPESDPASRGYFARLVGDGSALLTYTADRSAPETEWHTWKNRCVLYDIASSEMITTDLPVGYVFRYALAEHSASFLVLGSEEDSLVTVDVDPESGDFGAVLGTIALTPMTDRAMPGDAFYEKAAYRSIAVSPDGHQLFVSQGGDGIVQVIDPHEGKVTATLEHETPLTGGGTLALFGTAVPMWDTIGR